MIEFKDKHRKKISLNVPSWCVSFLSFHSVSKKKGKKRNKKSVNSGFLLYDYISTTKNQYSAKCYFLKLHFFEFLELTVGQFQFIISFWWLKKNTILYYVLYSFRFVIMENISTFHLALVLAFINRCKQIRKQKAKKKTVLKNVLKNVSYF